MGQCESCNCQACGWNKGGKCLCPKPDEPKEKGDPYPYGKQDVEPIEDNEVDFETEEQEDIRIVRARLKRMQEGPGP